jgi:putative DNA primase/helicase
VKLKASIGKGHPAEIYKTWEGDFPGFVKAVIGRVPEATDKASNGWICGAAFTPAYRHTENFQGRYFLSLDYDHIQRDDIGKILSSVCAGTAYLAYTTWSHQPETPRIRVWIPLSRSASPDEFQAVSRAVANRGGLIELAARESHTPCQFMYRPTAQKGVPFQHWEDTSSPVLDVDAVLAGYADWHDKKQWPKRKENDEVYDTDDIVSPLKKPGLVGAFCRAFTVRQTIERFDLPYRQGSGETRWTYTGGSRADGAVEYDDSTKFHSHHDTDPARGQHNAYDLLRLHRFGSQDAWDADTPIDARPSSRSMEELCRGLVELRDYFGAGFTAIPDEPVGPGAADDGKPAEAGSLPDEISRGQGLCNDLENARRIQRQFGKQIISVAGVFHIWTGAYWKPDTHEGEVWRKVAKLPRIVMAEVASFMDKCGPTPTEDETAIINNLKDHARMCSNKKSLDACREILRKLLNFDAALLNTDRALFNARNLTINLETGKTHPHNPKDFLTACSPTDYDPKAECPRFEKFISEIFEDNAEVVAFVKRWLGYCITGESREQSLVFHVGKGGNGKSTLMSTMSHVLGSYTAMGPKSLITGTSGISNDVAGLVGKRMVTINETRQNEEFDQGQLKQLTGGDKISARFLHKEFFEFAPTHKLQIFTNHEPTIVGEDGGMWRRMILLRYRLRYGTPFQVASGEYQKLRDEKLEGALKAEAPGILRWLVEGAREWYGSKLNAPASVLADTAALRDEQDIMANFLRERTVRDPEGRVPYSNSTESIYKAYQGWMHENGQRALGRNKFVKQLKEALPLSHDCRWQEKGELFIGVRGIRLARSGEAQSPGASGAPAAGAGGGGSNVTPAGIFD